MESFDTVLVSGLHSGPNPSPGLGVARSLRASGRPVRLVGLDYSSASSGLHTPILDEVVQFPPWTDIDVPTWRRQVTALLDREAATLIPTLDLELHLLAQVFGGDDRILSPSSIALLATSKPPLTIASALELGVADHLMTEDIEEIGRFIRASSDGVWVKGEHYEAYRAYRVDQVLDAVAFVERAWGGSWHLEAHVPGQECGLAFAARDGVLLDAVFMAKTLLTADGKTWSGQVSDVADDLLVGLAKFVAGTGWTGGGEVEMVRGWGGDLVVLELNPRFPAWIHGATACGVNLPAALLTGGRNRSRPQLSAGFTRVVEEFAVSPRIGTAGFQWASADTAPPATKNPSGMRDLARRHLIGRAVTAQLWTVEAADREADRLRTRANPAYATPTPSIEAMTPRREVFPTEVERRVAEVRAALAGLPEMTLAYSVKTCPHPDLMRAASRLGLVAEAITLDELAAATAAGFDPRRAILNGPAKWWPSAPAVECDAFFADSLAELRQLDRRLREGFTLTCRIVGVRVARVNGSSRFGVPLASPGRLGEVAALVAELCGRLDAAWGIHFHLAQSIVGGARWVNEAIAALGLADGLAARLGRGPAVVDLGGGWDFDDLSVLRPAIDQVVAAGPASLRDGTARLVLEPGKLLTQAAAAVVSRVLVADEPPAESIVVDTTLGELPEAAYRVHPVARLDGDRWVALPPGTGRILGRSCMENDILRDRVDVSALQAGDLLSFGMAGAYDLAMAYPFGRGTAAEAHGAR